MNLAHVQKEELKSSDDYKDYLGDIVDLDTKEIYFSNALIGSLDDDNFIIVNKNKKLQYVKIDTKNHKIENISKEYDYIINPIHYALKPIYEESSSLWGYIDNKCNEIIKPKFKNYGFFNDGFTIIKEDEKYLVIDEKGNIILDNKDEIYHYEYDYFFVKKDDKYAVFKKDKIYIDFFDTEKEIEEIKKDKNINDENLIEYLQRLYCRETLLFTSEDNPAYILLRLKISYKKREIRKKIFTLPLIEYIKLFDTFKSEKDLSQAGLFSGEVKIKDCEILNKYKDLLENPNTGIIG